MDHIQAIDARDADSLHRHFLHLANELRRLLAALRPVVQHVQDGTDLVVADNLFEFGPVQVLTGLVLHLQDGDLDHLSGFLLEGHPFEDLFYF